MNDDSLDLMAGDDLSPATLTLLCDLVANMPTNPTASPIEIDWCVGYVCGALDPTVASKVEEATSNRDSDRGRLVESFRKVRRFQEMSLGEVRALALSNPSEAPYALAYLTIATQPAESMDGGFAALLKKSADGARTALAALKSAYLASEAMGMPANVFRSGSQVVTLEGGGQVELLSNEHEIKLRFPGQPKDDKCFVSLDTPTGRLRLSQCEIVDGAATIGLAPLDRQNGTFVVRVGEWPEGAWMPPLVCQHFDQVVPPFVKYSRLASVNEGMLSIDLEWDEEAGLDSPGELAVSYAIGPDQWQFLGTQKISSATGKLMLRFEYPGENGSFAWPLKLMWRSGSPTPV